MKRKMIGFWIFAWLVNALLIACNPKVGIGYPAEPAANFALRFEYGSCNTDILDTFNGSYTKDMIVEPGVTIAMALSEEQMRSIYQEMVRISFFEYPEAFAIPTPKDGVVGMVTPAMNYRITVRNGDTTKMLTWTDEIVDPTTPEADRLRELFQVIIEIIEEHPKYKKLPVPKAGCV